MWIRILLAALLAMLASGCAILGRATEPETVTVDTSCAWARPIYVSRGDVLTDETARALLSHNEAGAKRCGWQRHPRPRIGVGFGLGGGDSISHHPSWL